MPYQLGSRSLRRLVGVHPDLRAVIEHAITITDLDFSVLEGLRSLSRQRELLAAGATRTLRSRHLTGHAVDVAPYVGGRVRWDWPLYHRLAPQIMQAAADVGVPVEWGGHWRKFRDGPHWQLPWDRYPG